MPYTKLDSVGGTSASIRWAMFRVPKTAVRALVNDDRKSGVVFRRRPRQLFRAYVVYVCVWTHTHSYVPNTTILLCCLRGSWIVWMRTRAIASSTPATLCSDLCYDRVAMPHRGPPSTPRPCHWCSGDDIARARARALVCSFTLLSLLPFEFGRPLTPFLSPFSSPSLVLLLLLYYYCIFIFSYEYVRTHSRAVAATCTFTVRLVNNACAYAPPNFRISVEFWFYNALPSKPFHTYYYFIIRFIITTNYRLIKKKKMSRSFTCLILLFQLLWVMTYYGPT